MQIITGGASAVYGSDAIAGVVNLRLKDDFEGIRFDSQFARYAEGDGDTTDLSLTLGGNFADGRGNAVLSLSWSDRDGVDFMAREFFRRHPGGTDFRIKTGTYELGGNLPTQAAVDAVFGGYGAASGRVPVSPTTYLGFNDDGTLFAANKGPFNWRGPAGQLNDTGTQLNNLNQFSLIQVPLERHTAFGRATFDITDAVEAYAQFSWSSLSSYVAAEAGNTGINVPVTNPFIPGDLRTILASPQDPDAAFRLHERFQEAGPRTFEREFDSWQFLAGARGPLPAINGSWDAYASKGQTRAHEVNNGAVVIASLRNLLDAPDGGASLCAGGYNPFGRTVLSPQCRDYLVAATISDTEFRQDVFEANAQGGLFQPRPASCASPPAWAGAATATSPGPTACCSRARSSACLRAARAAAAPTYARPMSRRWYPCSTTGRWRTRWTWAWPTATPRRGRRGHPLAHRLRPGRARGADRTPVRPGGVLRRGAGAEPGQHGHDRHGLRRAPGDDRGSADAPGPLHGQARRRAGQGPADGEDPALSRTALRPACTVSRGACAPGIRRSASRSGATRCARTRRPGARPGTAPPAVRRRCRPG